MRKELETLYYKVTALLMKWYYYLKLDFREVDLD